MDQNNQNVIWNETQMPAEKQSGGLDILGMLRRRKWFIVLGLAVGLGFGYYMVTQAVEIFESRASVLIRNKKSVATNSRVFQDTASFRSHHTVMNSTEFIKEVVELSNLQAQCNTFKNKSNGAVAAKIAGGLNVSPKSRTDPNIFNLSFRCTSSEDCQTVLDAVIARYRKRLASDYKNEGEGAVRVLKSDVDATLKKLDAAIAAYDEFRAKEHYRFRNGRAVDFNQQIMVEFDGKIRTTEFQIEDLKNDLQWIQQNLAQLQKEDVENREIKRRAIFSVLRSESKLIVSEKKAEFPKLAKLESGLKKFDPDAPQKEDDIESNPKLFELNMQLKKLLEKRAGNHIAVREKKREIAEWTKYIQDQMDKEEAFKKEQQAYLAKKLKELNESSKEEAERLKGLFAPKQIDPMITYQYSLQVQIAKLKDKLALYKNKHQIAMSEATEASKYVTTDRRLLENIEREKGMYEAVLSRFRNVELGSDDTDNFVFEELEKAGRGWQAEPNVMRILTKYAMYGILIGLGLAYLVEIADKTFRTPDEISQSLGCALIGHIPVLTAPKKGSINESPIDETVVSYHRPKSLSAESFRAVRTALYFSTQGENHKVIQVTSATPGDGKSTLSSNLAVSIAQSGKKTLLVDADLRRPTIHYLMGINSEVGFAQVLSGDADPQEAILETSIPGLYVMPCGEKPGNPAELLTSLKLAEALDVLREEFDFVIIDSPPLLAVTDPVAVAARADGTIMAIRIKKNVKVSAERAVKVLNTVNANIVGVVVNGVGSSTGAAGNYSGYGGYGAPYYQYGGYGYGYGNYGNGQSGEYYEDSEDTEFVSNTRGISGPDTLTKTKSQSV